MRQSTAVLRLMLLLLIMVIGSSLGFTTKFRRQAGHATWWQLHTGIHKCLHTAGASQYVLAATMLCPDSDSLIRESLETTFVSMFYAYLSGGSTIDEALSLATQNSYNFAQALCNPSVSSLQVKFSSSGGGKDRGVPHRENKLNGELRAQVLQCMTQNYRLAILHNTEQTLYGESTATTTTLPPIIK